jgi:hypothetical protein
VHDRYLPGAGKQLFAVVSRHAARGGRACSGQWVRCRMVGAGRARSHCRYRVCKDVKRR